MLRFIGVTCAALALLGCPEETCGLLDYDEELDQCVCPDPFVFASDGSTCVCPAPLVLSADETTCVMVDGGIGDGSMSDAGCSAGETRPCTATGALGECANGTETCAGGAFGDCEPGEPVAEICDGLDNDCDGAPDGVAASAACADLPNTRSSVCTAGECVIAECDDGFDDCNDDGVDGCEAELATDADHCGMCDMACDGADLCAAESCVSPPLHEWSISMQSSVADVNDVSVDDSGNLFVVGEYIISLSIGGVTRTGTLGSREGFLVSLGPDGRFGGWSRLAEAAFSRSVAQFR